MITGGFLQNNIDELKNQIQLIRSDDSTTNKNGLITHHCEDSNYRRRYGNCFCEANISKKFVHLIQDIMGHPKEDHYLNGRWIALYGDAHRFDIFGPTCVVRICAGAIGRLDGIPSQDYEVCLHARVSPVSGKYDRLSNNVYRWHTKFEFKDPHGRASDETIWKAHPELRELQEQHIPTIVQQFCHVME